MRAAVPIEHDGVRGLVAVGIIVEAIDHPVGDQLPMLIVAAVIALLLAFCSSTSRRRRWIRVQAGDGARRCGHRA